LDFWMDGGRCLLGAKGRAIGTTAKAALDTGLTRPFPSIREGRLAKDLLKRYPGYAAVRFYRDESRALAAAQGFLGTGEMPSALRPFGEFLRKSEGLEERSRNEASDIAMPILPCPAALSPAVLLFKDADAALTSVGDIVAPLLLACAHRALHELDRFAEDYKETHWKTVDRRLGAYFERRGPFLYPRAASEAYDKFFDAALGAGVLLSPDYELPSMIPGEFDDGELAALAVALKERGL
jgi:glutamate-1-semialdehyde aminotransferase